MNKKHKETAMSEIVWRNVWCVNLKPVDLQEKAPKVYQQGSDGECRRHGLYGGGFMGEALVCLLPEDDGKWFVEIACKTPKSSCRHIPEAVKRTDEGWINHNEI